MLPFAMGLAACSGGSPLDKGNIITEAFMERNFADEIDFEYEEKVLEKVSVDFGEGMSYYGKAASWVLTTDGATKLGAYSILDNKYHVEPGEHLISVQYALDADDEPCIPYLVYDTEEEEKVTRHYVDESGTEVFTMKADLDAEAHYGEPSVSLYFRYLEETEREGSEYYVVYAFSNFALEEHCFATYTLEGSVSRKGRVSEFVPAVGSYYGYINSMAKYGHPELYLVESQTTGSGKRYAFFSSKEGKYVSSFEIPVNGRVFVSGDYYVVQYKTEVEERATSYDFYQSKNKYDLHTFRINYTNGAKEEIESKFNFADATNVKSYKDEKGVVRYTYFEKVKLINSDKSLDPENYGFLLDEKAEIAADVSGIKFDKLSKEGNYYVAVSEVSTDVYTLRVYDGKLNEVAYFPNVDATGHIFQGEIGFGLVGHDGKVLLQPTAAKIQALKDYNHFAAVYSDKTQLLEITEAGELKVIKEFAMEDYVPYFNTADDISFTSVDNIAGDFVSHRVEVKLNFVDVEKTELVFVDILTGEVSEAEYGSESTDVPFMYADVSARCGTVDMTVIGATTAEGANYMIRDSIVSKPSLHEFAAK